MYIYIYTHIHRVKGLVIKNMTQYILFQPVYTSFCLKRRKRRIPRRLWEFLRYERHRYKNVSDIRITSDLH